jgi:hypothetical protein
MGDVEMFLRGKIQCVSILTTGLILSHSLKLYTSGLCINFINGGVKQGSNFTGFVCRDWDLLLRFPLVTVIDI